MNRRQFLLGATAAVVAPVLPPVIFTPGIVETPLSSSSSLLVEIQPMLKEIALMSTRLLMPPAMHDTMINTDEKVYFELIRLFQNQMQKASFAPR